MVDDTLIKVYCTGVGDIWGYCLPAGKNIKGAIEAIIDDAKERGCKAKIVMLTNEQRAVLEALYPCKFDYIRSPENQDYIYLTEDWQHLQGKNFTQNEIIFQDFTGHIPSHTLRRLTV